MRRVRSLVALGVAVLLLASTPPRATAETSAEHLLALVETKDLDQIRAYLAQPGVGIDDRPGGKSMLDFAAERNLVDVVQYLLDHGADVDDHSQSQEDKIVGRPGITALCRAAYCNAPDAMELLLKHDAAVNSPRGTESLFMAVKSGSGHSVELLLAQGATPDAAEPPPQPGPQWVGAPALAGAIINRSQFVVEDLLAHGASPDMPSGHGFPPGVGIYAGFNQVLGGLLDQWVTNWLYQPRYQGPDIVANAKAVFRHGGSPDPWLYSVLAHLQLRATVNHLQLPDAVRKGIDPAPKSEQTRQVADGMRATGHFQSFDGSAALPGCATLRCDYRT